MPVTIEDVTKIARLAKLEFDDQEIIKFTDQFNQILAYVEKMNELNTDQVEPLAQVLDDYNVFRQDKVTLSLPREQALQNAPKKTESYFIVPQVIGG